MQRRRRRTWAAWISLAVVVTATIALLSRGPTVTPKTIEVDDAALASMLTEITQRLGLESAPTGRVLRGEAWRAIDAGYSIFLLRLELSPETVRTTSTPEPQYEQTWRTLFVRSAANDPEVAPDWTFEMLDRQASWSNEPPWRSWGRRVRGTDRPSYETVMLLSPGRDEARLLIDLRASPLDEALPEWLRDAFGQAPTTRIDLSNFVGSEHWLWQRVEFSNQPSQPDDHQDARSQTSATP